MSELSTTRHGAARWAAMCLALIAVACGGPTRHRDGEGPMASLLDPDGSTRMAIARAPGVDRWSFGMFLCLQEPSPAVIQEVVPHGTVGSGVDEVGTAIHEFTFSSGEIGTISAEGYPPETATTIVPVEGYVLDVVCSNPGPDRAAELLVGLSATSDDGGGWTGADVRYSVGDREFVLEIRNEMIVCGPAVADYCEGGPGSPMPS